MTALCIILGAVIVLFILLLLIYRKAFHSPDKIQNDICNIPSDDQYAPHREHMLSLVRNLAALPCEEIIIQSYDSLQLFGRYYHHADNAPLDICFHGYRGTGTRDMCGGIRICRRLGHNVLIVDQRSHGNSQGHAITFGVKERHDCRSWVQYARERFGPETPIMLYGVSMGAATVLMASDMDFGGSVRGIIADSPYSSPKEIILKVCRDMHLPVRPAWPLIYLSARLFAGFNPCECSAVEAAARSSLPILIIHGEDDRFVPCEMSRAIAAARAGIYLHTFPGAGHGISNIIDTPRYNAIAADFIRRCCGK